MPRPIDIEHDRGRRQLTITWESGPRSVYPLGYLRGWCPCAECQGHGNTTTFLGQREVEATSIAEVGAYAITIAFSDGHDGGIYSWDWLHRLAEHSEPRGPKSGVYSGGEFRPVD